MPYDFSSYYDTLSLGSPGFPALSEIAASGVDPIAYLRANRPELVSVALDHVYQSRGLPAFSARNCFCDTVTGQNVIRAALHAGLDREELLTSDTLAVPLFTLGPVVAVGHFDPLHAELPFVQSDLQLRFWIPDPADFFKIRAAFHDIVRDFLTLKRASANAAANYAGESPYLSVAQLEPLRASNKGTPEGAMIVRLVKWAMTSPFLSNADRNGALENILRESERNVSLARLPGDYHALFTSIIQNQRVPWSGKGGLFRLNPALAKNWNASKLASVCAYPYFETENTVFVLVRDVALAVDDLIKEVRPRKTICKIITTADSIQQCIQGERHLGPDIKAQAFSNAASTDAKTFDKLVPIKFEHVEGKPPSHFNQDPTQLLAWALFEGARLGASDVHIEVAGAELIIRHVIDGSGRLTHKAPTSIATPIKSVLYGWMGLNPGRAEPADGRFGFVFQGRPIDVRVAVDYALSATFGTDRPKAVLRLLDKTMGAKSLSELGLTADEMEMIRHYINLPYGMILITGPTGSGKSTTLNAAVKELVSPDRFIYSCEDPIEYEIPGVFQRSVSSDPARVAQNKDLLSFLTSLRTFVRMDPDVIYVGEIRDSETAVVSIDAASTGHLILSSMHTNDVFGTIVRLVDFGVDPFKGAEALELIISQRLVRRVCQCASVRSVTPSEAAFMCSHGIHEDELKDLQVPQKVGCPECDGSGYRGRVVVMEFLRVTEAIKRLIERRAPISEVREKAEEENFVPLSEAGIRKVLQGVTTMEEVKRVLKFKY